MRAETQTDVLVVGAGPVGLTLAHDLARRGIDVRIIDRAEHASRHSKALAVFARTLEEFDARGLAESMVNAGRRLKGAIVHAGERELAQIRFDELPSRFPFVLCLPQSRTEALLEQALTAAGRDVQRTHELLDLEERPDHISAEIRRSDGAVETVRSSYLAACDGAHSTVRQALTLRFEGTRHDDAFILADAKISGPLDRHHLHLRFSQRGVLVLIPISDDIVRVIADRCGDAGHAPARDPTPDDIQACLETRGAAGLRVESAGWISRFFVSRRMVRCMRHGRVFLCGDSAHIHSPAGDQGMNTDMQDAWNLGWKLAMVLRGQAHDELLDSYDAERRPVAASVLRSTDAITRLATLEGTFAQGIRNGFLHFLSGIHPLVETAAEHLAELRLDYRSSPIVKRNGDLSARVRPGDRAPDGALERYDRSARRQLHDWLREGSHVLVAFTGHDSTTRTQLDDLRSRVRDHCGDAVIFLPVGADDSTQDVDDAWHDIDGNLHARYGAEDGAVVLVRPDGFVGYRGAGLEGEAFARHWRRIFTEAVAPHAGS